MVQLRSTDPHFLHHPFVSLSNALFPAVLVPSSRFASTRTTRPCSCVWRRAWANTTAFVGVVGRGMFLRLRLPIVDGRTYTKYGSSRIYYWDRVELWEVD